MKEAKTSQDIFDKFFNNCFAEHFQKRLSENRYDIERLRQELDDVSFRSSCTYSTEDDASKDLSRLEKCEVILESLKSMKELGTAHLTLMFSIFGIFFTFGTNMLGISFLQNDPQLVTSLTNLGIIILVFIFALLTWKMICISRENRLREALLIISKEEKRKETKGGRE